MHSIKTALEKIETVSEVNIDKDTEIITVNAAVTRAVLVKTLSNLGYPEKGHNSLINIGKSYVSCAIGKMTK
jgi:copper chaperone CopZ